MHNNCPRSRVLALFKSCPGGGGGGMVMDKIDTCIK